jgi:hypothetical protein
VLLALFAPATPRMQRALLAIFGRLLPLPFLKPRSLLVPLLTRTVGVGASLPQVDVLTLLLLTLASSLSPKVRNQQQSDKLRALRAPGWPRRLQTREAVEVQNLLRRLSRMPHWRELYTTRLSHMLENMRLMTAASSDAITEFSEMQPLATGPESVGSPSASLARVAGVPAVWLALGVLALLGGDSNETALSPDLYRVPAEHFVLDAHDGTCRVKVLNATDGSPRIILTVDLARGKAMAEFRRQLSGAAVCRFCATDLTPATRAPPPASADSSIESPDTLLDVCTEVQCSFCF